MNTSILIIGLAIVAAFVIPMVIINNHGKTLKAKKKKALDDFAQANGLTIKDVEYFKEMTLALDRNSRKLAYLAKNDTPKLVDLNLVTTIKLDKQYENEEKKIIGSVDIILSTKDELVTIPFYHHSKKNSTDLYEMNESAKVWMRNIETCKAGKAKDIPVI